ncbi:translin [Anaeramoeba ignava]|uniref:Translin n=1 Tax=Anaeramoeba ignava TaxID=1746090 RepID=A0A9Q0LAC3_ANAIG|nr:translin [Anaeramoeba ignava]
MDEIFKKFEQIQIKNSNQKEEIHKIIENIEKINKSFQIILSKAHFKNHDKNEIVQKSKEFIPELKQHYKSLFETIPKEYHHKFYDSWKFTCSSTFFNILFLGWIENERVYLFSEIADILGLEIPEKENDLGIDVHIYLLSLFKFCSELARLCVNSVTAGNYEMPWKISLVVSEIYSRFKLLNTNNDVFGKKINSLKFDLKKIEEVVFDVHKLQTIQSLSQKITKKD